MFDLLNQVGNKCRSNEDIQNCDGCPLRLHDDNTIDMFYHNSEISTYCGLIALMIMDSPEVLSVVTEDNLNDLVHDLQKVITRKEYEEVLNKYGYKG